MTWTLILDRLADLGAATVDWFWLPVLAWTALALPLWVLLKRTGRLLHPNAEYRLSQGLFFTLPVGLVAGGLSSLIPVSPSMNVAMEGRQLALSAIGPFDAPASQPGPATGEISAGLVWHWMYAVGLMTVIATVVGLIRLGRVVLDAVAAVRVHCTVATFPTPWIQAQVHKIAEEVGLERPVRVCVTPEAVAPVTLAGFRPTVLLPPSITERREALRMTLLHELTHLHRYDDLVNLVERVVGALFAVHPLVGALQRHIAAARERACDAVVLGDDQTSPAAYARLLATFAEGTPRTGRLGTLSLSELSSSVTGRIAAMRSLVPSWLSSPVPRNVTLAGTCLVLMAGMIACSDVGAPSTPEPQSSPYLTGDDAVWTPVADARNAGEEWLTHLNHGRADVAYKKAAPMTHSLSQEEWAAWVEKRRTTLGGEQSRRFAGARINTNFGPPENPSVMLTYVLRFETGETCQPAVVMVLADSSWNVGLYGPSCGDLSFPEEASSSVTTAMSSPDRLPTPTGETTFSQQPTGTLQRQIDPAQLPGDVILPARVAVTVVVDNKGDISSAELTQEQDSQHPTALTSAALQAVRSLDFEPGRLGGKPVRTRIHIPVHFNASN